VANLAGTSPRAILRLQAVQRLVSCFSSYRDVKRGSREWTIRRLCKFVLTSLYCRTIVFSNV
jgi:hypothetical protein